MSGAITKAFAIDEAGNPVALQEHQLAGASALQPVTQQQASQLTQRGKDADYVDQNYGTAGKAGLGFANGLTLGLGPAALSHMGMLDQGHLEAAQETGAFGVGDVAGMLAPAVLSGGESLGARSVIGKALRYGTPAGLMGEAGGVAGRLVGSFLPEAGLMGKVLAPTLRMAAQGATEGSLINMARTASDDIIQNKPLAAQALLASGAEGALFGGLTGGILGGATALAGSGVSALGRRSASALAGKGDEAAIRALGHVGADASDVARMKAAGELTGEGGAVHRYYDALQHGGESYASEPSAIHASAKKSAEHFATIESEATQQLQKEHPNSMPEARRVGARIESDVMVKFGDQLETDQAAKIVKQLRRELEGTSVKAEGPVKPTVPESPTSRGQWEAYRVAKDAHENLPTNMSGGLKTWENWTVSREQLADRASKASGIKQEVYNTALNAFDSELRTAMEAADPALASQFSAAAVQRRTASELVGMSAKGAASRAARGDPLALNVGDATTAGFAAFTGANPLVAAGIIAGKKAFQYASQRMEPVIAEYAARSAMGAAAGHAVASVGQRVSDGLKVFMNGGRRLGINAESGAAHDSSTRKLSYSMKSYQAAMDMADELTSANHMAKVREMAQSLTAAGHPELGQEMAETYGRAVAYIKHNQPKSGKEHSAGKLTKTPKALSPSTQGMKFMRQMRAATNPLSIIDDLMDGKVSPDAVATVKYIAPDLHADIVYRAQQQIMTNKEAGKYMPADKLAMLGTVLDAVVDSSLEPSFVDAVQQGLAANKAPPPKTPPAPNTDTSSYQTPLQSSVT